MRDDFSQTVKNEVGARVGWHCSNPGCQQSTSGPSDSEKRVTNVGVAAHIAAASPGGPRFDPTLAPEERSSVQNAIWLCQLCAKAIDDDPVRYTPGVLADWKAGAEARARIAIEERASLRSPSGAQALPIVDERHPILSMRAAKGQQWRTWIHDELRLGFVLSGSNVARQRALYALNMRREYLVSCTEVETDRLSLTLRPLRYEYLSTMQSIEGIETQFVAAIRPPDEAPRITSRLDTRDGVPVPAAPAPAASALAHLNCTLSLVVSSLGVVLSARSLGDPFDPSGVSGDTGQLLTGLRWLASAAEAARYTAHQIIVETTHLPVAIGVEWPTNRKLDVMGFRLETKGTVTVIETLGPSCRMRENGHHETDASQLGPQLEATLETIAGVPVALELAARESVPYTREWLFDSRQGWPRTMSGRLPQFRIDAHATWMTDGEPSEGAVAVDASAVTQSGWEMK